MSIETDETMQVFIEESLDHLADIENDFLAIEQAGADIDDSLVNKVYRAAHSIKGGAGFMGLTNIKNLTHEMEDILGKVRSREMVPTSDIINVLLAAADTLRNLLKDVASSNDADVSLHLAALQRVKEGQSPPPPAAQGPVGPFADGRRVVAGAQAQGQWVYLVELDLARTKSGSGADVKSLIDEIVQTGTVLATTAELQSIDTAGVADHPVTFLFATILRPEDINLLFGSAPACIHLVGEDMNLSPLAMPAADPEPVPVRQSPPVSAPVFTLVEGDAPMEETPPEEIAAAPKALDGKQQCSNSASTWTETNLKVNVGLLDSLMNLAGELVLGRNQLIQALNSKDLRATQTTAQRLDLITTELQEAIMLTRMQPIGNVFNKFPRVVRDLAKSLGKQVDLVIEGKDVELDKTIIEAIGDPLTHLVRNAVDHGIEIPAQRQKAGKKSEGRILLRAYHEAGQVNIEISDDGKGIDGRHLAQVAVTKGLISEDQAKVMSEKEKINLIFLPGFSTAKQVTDVSGRGVGMDVVKTNLDRLGGIVDIDSAVGKGSTLRIKLPLTLAIIPCQIIKTGGERYAIPQVNLEELLRISADQIGKRIEKVGDAEVVRLRGDLLPLIKLSKVIGVQGYFSDPHTGESTPDRRAHIADRRSRKSPLVAPGEALQEQEAAVVYDRRGPADRRYHAASALNIVVVSTGAMKYGLVVDELNDSEEIVVKPLGRHLKQCKGYAGATIMGDGRVALILDVANLAKMAGLTSVEGSARAADVAREASDAIRARKDMQSLLIFRSAEDEQFAAPLSQVERIEKIKRSEIEALGGRKVMKYRGGSLPLFTIDQVATVKPLADREDLLVIVFIVAGREVGLLAMGPVDAMELSLNVDSTTLRQTGIMGSAIIANHTTMLVDIFELVRTVHPDWFAEPQPVQTADKRAATILMAEDSNFFRSQVKRFIEEEGYTVMDAEDGQAAWDLLTAKGKDVAAVVTDIEMPRMNGLELTAKIKGDPRFAHLPVIALTTLASEEDIARGRAVGVDDYQIKLDREKLTDAIHRRLRVV